jgi:hypothetical protein
MSNRVIPVACAGHLWPNSIKIDYSVQGLETRTAYLPNSPRGQRILAKLKIAFDRRFVFSMGTSLTTGCYGPVWTIHHKTSLNGGPRSHGYPDATYLDRVEEELKERGVGDELLEEISNS